MIRIINLTADLTDNEFFKKIAKIVLRGENQGNKDLSIVLVNQDKIKELNRKYRKKNKATDVLSFELGDVIICLPEVKKNAKRYQITFQKELTRVLIHGILHLLGYDHKKTKIKAEEMRKKEEKYFLNFKFQQKHGKK